MKNYKIVCFSDKIIGKVRLTNMIDGRSWDEALLELNELSEQSRGLSWNIRKFHVIYVSM